MFIYTLMESKNASQEREPSLGLPRGITRLASDTAIKRKKSACKRSTAFINIETFKPETCGKLWEPLSHDKQTKQTQYSHSLLSHFIHMYYEMK